MSKTIGLITTTHAAIACDQAFRAGYRSGRWNGKDMFPCGACKEYLHKGFYARYKTPCAVCELYAEDSVCKRAREAAIKIIDQQRNDHFKITGLLLCQLKGRFMEAAS